MDKTCHSDENKKWSALDYSNPHPSFKNASVSEATRKKVKLTKFLKNQLQLSIQQM